MTKINKSELMTNAWLLVREYNMSLSEALKSAWSFAKIELTEKEIEAVSMSKIDLIVSGSQFVDNKGIKWEVLKNKEYTTMTTDVDEEGNMIFGLKVEKDLFVCEMVDFGGPRNVFSRDLILKLTA